MRQIYLDYNATTPVAPSVQEAMLPFLAEHFGNPSSSHAVGRAAQEAVEDGRSRLATLLGCDVEEIVFTSGGSEANNLALKGVLLRRLPRIRGHLVISAFEHPATSEPAQYLRRMGFDLTIVPVSRAGMVDPEDVRQSLRSETQLVSIMHANNEIGTIQPIREIAEICRERQVLLHTDAAQTVGKVRTKVEELGIDLLSLAGHKMYAPKGIGVLYVRNGTSLEPLIHGASHESNRRAGTENVPYIVALGQAARLAERGLDEAGQHLVDLRDRLLDRLREALGEELTANGEFSPRLPNTLSVNFPRVSAAELLARAPDVCASTGSACHSGTVSLSPTLAALGLAAEAARGTVRLSVGWYTTEEDVDRAADSLLQAWESLV